MKPRSAIVLIVFWLAWLFLESPLWRMAPAVLLPCVLMAFLCLYPIWRWLDGNFATLPVMETYALAHIPYYLVPFLEAREDLVQYAAEIVFKSALMTCVYLLILEAAWFWGLSLNLSAARSNWLFKRRSLPDIRESVLMWSLLGLWWLSKIALFQWRLLDLGAAFNIARTLTSTCGVLALFYLFLRYGQRELRNYDKFILVSLMATGLALELTSGFLVLGGSTVLLCLLAYAMGSKRVPFWAAAGCCLLFAFLHVGKAEMRSRYWLEGKNYGTTLPNPLDVYAYWVGISWQKMFSAETREDRVDLSILRRASLGQYLTLVVAHTPGSLDFLNGQTYLMAPQLLIPRVFWKDKPAVNLPNDTLAVTYGVLTEEGVESTATSLGQIAEAWANYGWLGVVLVGAALGLILVLPNLLASGCSSNQVGFLIGVVFLASSFTLEPCFGPWLISLLQGLVVAFGGLYFLSRPTPRQTATHSRIHPGVPQPCPVSRVEGRGSSTFPAPISAIAKPPTS